MNEEDINPEEGLEEIRKKREGEGTLDYRKRIYPDYKANRRKNQQRLGDDDIQAQGDAKLNPTGDMLAPKTPEEIAAAEKGIEEAKKNIKGKYVKRERDSDGFLKIVDEAFAPKRIRGSTSFDDETRFQEQLKSLPKITIQDLSELGLDAKMAMETAKKVPGGPAIKVGAAVGSVILRRVGSKALRGVVDNVFDAIDPYNFLKKQAVPVYAMGKGSQKGARFGTKGFGSLDDVADLDEFLLSKLNRYDVADESLRKANINPKNPFYKRLRLAARQVPEYVRRNDDGFLYFDYNLFKDSMRPKQHGRAYIQLFESDLDTVLKPTNFTPDAGKGTKLFREFNIAEFRETFRPAAELLGLTGKKQLGRMNVSNVHHIAALKGTMGIYDGLGFNSPMFRQVNRAMKESLGGMGAERANLIRLVGGTADKGSPHQLAHFFLDEALGTRGEKFFSEDVLLKMNLDDSYRLSKARELGRIVADSEKVALQAQEAYKRLADAALATDFKDIQDTLERLVTSEKLGFVKLNNVNYKPIIRETAERGGYNVRQFDKLIEDIALIHKAVPTGSPKLIDELLFSPQLLRSQKSFQKLVGRIEQIYGTKGVTGAKFRRILDKFDVRMQNQGVGQTGLFEDLPDNLLDQVITSVVNPKKTRR
tara:strand:- start:58 stop:2001 length:1944 start_codon:yes stop_codon:yes gene_type:complete